MHPVSMPLKSFLCGNTLFPGAAIAREQLLDERHANSFPTRDALTGDGFENIAFFAPPSGVLPPTSMGAIFNQKLDVIIHQPTNRNP
jgi:hypothetical protein